METFDLPDTLILRPEGAELGDGLHSGTFEFKQNPFLSLESRDLTIEKGLFWQSFVAQSHQELAKKLQIEASASGKYGCVSADAATKFTDQFDISRTSLVVGIRMVATVKATRVAQAPALTGDAESLLDDDASEFLNTYGDFYVRELWYGPELILAGSLDAASEERKREIYAMLGGKYDSGAAKVQAKAEVTSNFHQLCTSQRIQMKVYQRGESTFDFGDAAEHPDKALATAAEWAGEPHGDSLQRVVCMPYSALDLAPAQKGKVRALDRRCNPFQLRRDAVMAALLEVDRALAHVPADAYDDVWLDDSRDDWLAELRERLANVRRRNAADLDHRMPAWVAKVPGRIAGDLRARRIITSASHGGNGGDTGSEWICRNLAMREFRAGIRMRSHDLGPIFYDVGCTLEDGSTRLLHGRGWKDHPKQTYRCSLAEGEHIARIEILDDGAFVRQIKLWTSDGRSAAPATAEPRWVIPRELPEAWKRPSLTTKRYDGIVCGIHCRSGSWIDAMGVHYAEVAVPESVAEAVPVG